MSSPNQVASLTSDADDDGPITPTIAEVEANLEQLASTAILPAYTKTRNVRLQFQHAFELIGGIPRLAHWAHQHPTQFYQLYSKLIPAQVTGADGGPLRIELSWLNTRDTSGRTFDQSEPKVIDLDPKKSNGQG
jgi:hypothetical protein